MHAELRPFSRPPRLAGAATTLVTLSVLAFIILHPMVRPLAEPDRESEAITFVPVHPDVTPDVLPTIPLEKIDLPMPLAMVNLPEFENPVAAPALPSLAPVTSPDGTARPSGGDASVIGSPTGTGRASGSGGSTLVPPVRRGSSDAPFGLKDAERAGLVTSLNFCVTNTGRVQHVQLAEGSGFADTDAIAIDWLARQRFTPGTLDGVRVRMCATYDIRWSFAQASSAEAQTAARAHATTIRRRSRYPRQFVYWPEDRPFPGCDAVTVCKR